MIAQSGDKFHPLKNIKQLFKSFFWIIQWIKINFIDSKKRRFNRQIKYYSNFSSFLWFLSWIFLVFLFRVMTKSLLGQEAGINVYPSVHWRKADLEKGRVPVFNRETIQKIVQLAHWRISFVDFGSFYMLPVVLFVRCSFICEKLMRQSKSKSIGKI